MPCNCYQYCDYSTCLWFLQITLFRITQHRVKFHKIIIDLPIYPRRSGKGHRGRGRVSHDKIFQYKISKFLPNYRVFSKYIRKLGYVTTTLCRSTTEALGTRLFAGNISLSIYGNHACTSQCDNTYCNTHRVSSSSQSSAKVFISAYYATNLISHSRWKFKALRW